MHGESTTSVNMIQEMGIKGIHTSLGYPSILPKVSRSPPHRKRTQKPRCQPQGAERVNNIYKDQISLATSWVNSILVRDKELTP